MDWQQVIALTIVSAAAALLVWGKFGRRKMSFQRATHCGCSGAGLRAGGSIEFRVRKGGRPEVRMRMR